MLLTLTDAVASPFARLRTLLDNIDPAADPIDLSLGEPRHPLPPGIADILHHSIADFGRYPPIPGTPDLRQSIAHWIERRYPLLSGHIDPDHHIVPLNGSREGLFSAVFPALARSPQIENPEILIPNPFYQCYAAGALAGQAEPILLDARPENGFLPDLQLIPEQTLSRAAALYLCSPSNPEGAVASEEYLITAIELAQAHNFMIFSDECYSEIYDNDPPAGILQASRKVNKNFRNVIAFNSLSKRSNLPGLRVGFAAGDPDFLASFKQFRNVACPQIPLPIQQVAEAIWADETHVEQNRILYRKKFDIADKLISGQFGYTRPQGGFFLWLDMHNLGGGEAAVKTLWKEVGVKLLPGAYLAMAGPSGKNPAESYVRLALVQSQAQTEQALKRIVGIN